MKLKELVDEFNADMIRDAFKTHYPSQVKNVEGYVKALEELKTLKPKKAGGMLILLEERTDDLAEEDESKTYMAVCGLKPNDKDSLNWCLSYTDWREWLDMEIDPSSLDLAEDTGELMAHVLYEMTWMGYSNDDVMKKADELERRCKQIDKWKAEGTLEQHTFTMDEVKDKINKMLTDAKTKVAKPAKGKKKPAKKPAKK